jgi:hypothetical protein
MANITSIFTREIYPRQLLIIDIELEDTSVTETIVNTWITSGYYSARYNQGITLWYNDVTDQVVHNVSNVYNSQLDTNRFAQSPLTAPTDYVFQYSTQWDFFANNPGLNTNYVSFRDFSFSPGQQAIYSSPTITTANIQTFGNAQVLDRFQNVYYDFLVTQSFFQNYEAVQINTIIRGHEPVIEPPTPPVKSVPEPSAVLPLLLVGLLVLKKKLLG